jgi:hypothetical protein
MRIRTSIASTTLAAIFWSAPAFAQQHIADPAAIQQAMTDQQATDAANRALVLKTLDRQDARELADRMGLDLVQANAAVNHLTSDQLAQLAETARTINGDLSGGAQTLVISVTTLLLIIIIVLLVAD